MKRKNYETDENEDRKKIIEKCIFWIISSMNIKKLSLNLFSKILILFIH